MTSVRPSRSLCVLINDDDAIFAMETEVSLVDAGHRICGWAFDEQSTERPSPKARLISRSSALA